MAQMPPEIATAIHRLMVDYVYAVDDMADANAVADLFTPDAVIDFSASGFPKMEGRDEIFAFYDGLFASMAGQFHDVGNFRPAAWDGEIAVADAYVIGMGQPKDGARISVQVRYRWECVQSDDAWRCRRFSLTPMMPN